MVGAGGFIGSHLSEKILRERRDWRITAVDLHQKNVLHLMKDDNFQFRQMDILTDLEELEQLLASCDLLLPLAAIANPATYVEDPLRVFELDFEANLRLVKWAVKYRKRIIFPSTSEVYGMCSDTEFSEENSNCITGPIGKQRWIYSCSKQLLDRVIYAHGKMNGVDYTLFRPFNFIGPRLDNIHDPHYGASRVVSQFLSNILHGNDIRLVNGGYQQRCFTDIADGVEAIMKIIENPNNAASGQIFNIGNPGNLISIKELAQLMLGVARDYPQLRDQASRLKIVETTSMEYYGDGYQDVDRRVPAVAKINHLLGWSPSTTTEAAIRKIFDEFNGDTGDTGPQNCRGD
jgi:nucleoside-diphosphate-sugar epimerase